MPPDEQPAVGRRTARTLYGALLGGFVLILCLLAYLRFSGVLPAPLSNDTHGPLIALLLAAATVPGVTLGLLIFKPRVPWPAPHEAAEAYWSRPATIQSALLVWVLWEGAGIIGAVGFLLTGHVAPGGMAALALALLLLHGPGFFAGRSR